MDRLGVKWVSTTDEHFEESYVNSWLYPTYGKRAQHIDRLRASPLFCVAKTSRANTLYRYGPCQPGDPGP